MLVMQRPTIEAVGEESANRQRFAVGPLEPEDHDRVVHLAAACSAHVRARAPTIRPLSCPPAGTRRIRTGLAPWRGEHSCRGP